MQSRSKARRPSNCLRIARSAVLALALVVFLDAAVVTQALGAPVSASDAEGTPRFLVGRAVADITGEPANSDKDGYLAPDYKTVGLHQRQRARAFIMADPATNKRVAIVVAEVNMVPQAVRDEVLRRLEHRFGDKYTKENLLLSSTHTHSAPGGFNYYNFYNIAAGGFKPKNFDSFVDGVYDAVVKADADLAPGSLDMAIGELNNASANRSRDAFDRDPAADRAFFPDAIDPQTTLLQMSRNGRPVGALDWFATHGTSMDKTNRLISPDNKGYAAYHWEHDVEHVDYLSDNDPAFVAGFAQTNSGDMTPDLNLRPGSGPTEDDVENTKIIGDRQYQAAAQLSTGPKTAIDGPIDYRFTYVDMGDTTVDPAYTGDGKSHSTCSGAFGVGFAAGSKEDGPGVDFLNEGTGNNPLFDRISGALYQASPALKDCQAPKDILLASGDLGLTPNILPIQLVRIGQLYLIAIPQEATIVAGLRLRRTVSQIVGAPLQNVLVAGYSNSYAGYVTTPEEYDQGDYEAGHTMFGRWTLPAYQQHVAELARDMAGNRPTPVTIEPPDKSSTLVRSAPGPLFDAPALFHRFGDVLLQPQASYYRGDEVKVEFDGANPDTDLRRGSTYLKVERLGANGWQRMYDDGDWSTRFVWTDQGLGVSKITVTWDIPADAEPGQYRVTYLGDAKPLIGDPVPFSGVSNTFTVD
ncbi:neutral/alkaline ceramidase [Streptomyces sp. PD-S100-1]|uniref:neutral/alkaline ceramidase n=1 Tax=Streptomyces sp. PD-S100-1 TaxID=3394351 RepID=UPI0039BD0BF1